MLFSDSFLTIEQPSTGLFRDRGSKFLAYAFPVTSEDEIKLHLQALKKEHPSARHHCFAWRLGPDKSASRSNDDGEPSGTAGKPIMGQILSQDLTNILIVVVRYFGGTLLGAGGLINAYRSAAADALLNARVKEQFIFFEYKIEFTFEDMNTVMRLLKESEAKILSTDYENGNSVVFRIKKQTADTFEEKVKNIYKAKLSFIKTI